MSAAPAAAEAQQMLGTQAPLGKETLGAMALRITTRTSTAAVVVEQALSAETLPLTAEAAEAAQGKPLS
jgi:hypothetical protein